MLRWMRPRRVRLCTCGHDREAHRHYRLGSDCALCDCDRWRQPTLRWLSRRPDRRGQGIKALVRTYAWRLRHSTCLRAGAARFRSDSNETASR
jgi:hypothetical protein